MHFPKVSICIPTYNQVDYLKKTLSSIQEQDFDDYELVITDDSSTDSVEVLVKSYGFGEKLKYFRNEISLGSPENWNECIRRARGQLIKVMHHDDAFTCNRALTYFVQLLEENPDASFGFCATTVYNPSNNKLRQNSVTKKQLIMLSRFPEKLFFGNIIGAPSATIYRNWIGMDYDPRMKWLVDIDFYIRILRHNGNIAYIPDALIQTPTNVSHQVTELCKNDMTIEFNENLLLFSKVAPLLNEEKISLFWYRLFEKYKIYSLKELNHIGLDKKLSNLLIPFLKKYRKIFIYRIHHRLIVRLKFYIKNLR